MAQMISFDTTKQDQKTIAAIADRASSLALQSDLQYPTVDAMMDITATHANGCRLRLAELLAADSFNFAHDVFGIQRHLNRKTGQLEGCFIPRFARRQG